MKNSSFLLMTALVLLSSALPGRAQDRAMDFVPADVIRVTGFQGVTGSDSRTVEAWFRTTASVSVLAGQHVVEWGSNDSGGRFSVKTVAAGVRVEVQGGGVSGSTSVNDGAWHHVAVVFENDGSPDISEARIYIDGELDVPSVVTPEPVNTAATGDVAIGGSPDHWGRYYDGQLDELRIWNVARTQEQIQESMSCSLSGTEAGLLVYYSFDDGAAPVTDLSGNGNDGTLSQNGPAYVTPGVSLTGSCQCGPSCGNDLDRVEICHAPLGDPSRMRTVCVAMDSLQDHLDHGDSCGPCPAL